MTQQQQVALRQYLDISAANREMIDASSAPSLRQRSGESLMLHALEGISTGATYPNERFLYTDVATALAPDYGLNLQRRELAADIRKLYGCSVKGLKAVTLYVVGDMIQAVEPAAEALPEGVYAGSISAYPDQSHLRRLFSDMAWEPDATDPSSWVNSLLVQDGICIIVPDGVALPVPIQIVNLSDFGIDMMSNRRICICVGRGAAADIIVCEHAYGSHRHLSCCDVSVQMCEGSRLGYFSVEETNATNSRLQNIRVAQDSASSFTYNNITMDCGLTRTTLNIEQRGHDATASVCGALVADKEENADNYVRIVHGGEDNRSDMLFKYVLGGKAVGAFTGEIFVTEGARRIASEQQSNTLLTTEDARVYSRPVLEIYADDVKCNHGATVGKLDETALFYMQQRGIAEPDARLLLQHAFVNDVLQRIPIPALRDSLSTLVERRFRNGRAQCDGCRMAKICNDN